MILRNRPPVAATAAVLMFAAFAQASDWNQFRGPLGSGVSATSDLPDTWSEDENLAWSVDLPGQGWATPIVAGDRILVPVAVPQGDVKVVGFGGGILAMRGLKDAKPPAKPMSFEVHCLSLADGRSLWKRTITERRPDHAIHPSNTYATESPVTDGQNVYVLFASIGVVACLDLDGNPVWQKEFATAATSNNFGTGSSLTLADGLLFLQCDSQGQSFLTALDAATGEESWRLDREGGSCWSTPMIWRNNQRTELIVLGDGIAQSLDPITGDAFWSLTYPDGSFAASPAADEERVYFGNSGPGKRGVLVAVRAGASGELSLNDVSSGGENDGDEGNTSEVVTEAAPVAWARTASGPGMGSPVAFDGKLYIESRGVLACHDAETGDVIYKKRLPGAGSIAASMWVAGGKLHILDETGTTFVIDTGDEFKLVAKNKLAGLYWATPSVTADGLLLRAADKLHCIRRTP